MEFIRRFNFINRWRNRPFYDVWKILHSNDSLENGFTFVVDKAKTGLDSCRPDRILSNSEILEIIDVKISDGIDNPKNIHKIAISDHKVVFATFKLKS